MDLYAWNIALEVGRSGINISRIVIIVIMEVIWGSVDGVLAWVLGDKVSWGMYGGNKYKSRKGRIGVIVMSRKVDL